MAELKWRGSQFSLSLSPTTTVFKSYSLHHPPSGHGAQYLASGDIKIPPVHPANNCRHPTTLRIQNALEQRPLSSMAIPIRKTYHHSIFLPSTSMPRQLQILWSLLSRRRHLAHRHLCFLFKLEFVLCFVPLVIIPLPQSLDATSNALLCSNF